MIDISRHYIITVPLPLPHHPNTELKGLLYLNQFLFNIQVYLVFTSTMYRVKIFYLKTYPF
jgi:hypothetical protein